MLNLDREVIYKTSRSSGPGGQNVNKVNTRVTLIFNVLQSECLSSFQKDKIYLKLNKRINTEGLLIIHCEQTRSQLKNKEIALKQLHLLISNALIPSKKRKATKPTKSSRLKRLKFKKQNAEKKQNRKKPPV